MIAEWKEYTVAQLIEDGTLLIGDGYRAKNVELAKAGIPFARVANIDDGFDFSNVDFFPLDDLGKVGDKISRPGDTVFTSKGTVGRFAFVGESTQRFVYSPQLSYWRSRKHEVIAPRFLFYWMQGREFFAQSDAVKGQTDMADYVSLTDQRKMRITLPEIDEQRAIASILSSLDDKIDLLHRQNKTLEALAETLFRQWFVEEAEEKSELIRISEVAEINSRTVPNNYPYSEIEYLDTGSITDGIITAFQTLPLTDAPSRAQRIVRDHDIVYSLVRPIQRHYGLLHGVKPNTVASTGFCVVTGRDISSHFLYMLLTRDETVEYFDMIAEGSTSAYPSLKPSDVANFEFIKPPKDKLENFSNYASDAWRKIQSNQIQIRTLTQLRDTLSPKLMSGEVRVKSEQLN